MSSPFLPKLKSIRHVKLSAEALNALEDSDMATINTVIGWMGVIESKINLELQLNKMKAMPKNSDFRDKFRMIRNEVCAYFEADASSVMGYPATKFNINMKKMLIALAKSHLKLSYNRIARLLECSVPQIGIHYGNHLAHLKHPSEKKYQSDFQNLDEKIKSLFNCEKKFNHG